MTRFSLAAQAWQFGQTRRLPFDAPAVDDRAAVTRWLPATVPGNVRLDLHANGILPDPPHLNSEWVDDADWWYRVTFPVDVESGQRVFIRFAGLDYRAAIFVGDDERARHEGMFSWVTVDATDHIRGGMCRLAVRLWGSGALPRRNLSRGQKLWQAIAQRLQNSWTGVYPDRSATLKMQMSFGWDFAPRVLTTGIWDDVTCIITGETFIEDASVAVTPDGQGTLRVRLNTLSSTPVPLALTVTSDDAPHTFRFTIPPDPPETTRTFRLPAPKLWQPWDAGTPHLYTARLEIPGSDALSVRFGVRSVALENWLFRINGAPTFARGVNWVPADIFPGRITPADYRDLLTRAKACGANFIRVWGGGLREKSAFYDLCDELGLLVWQEFPLACLFLGGAPQSADFLALLRQEVGAIVRQLDAHPSVVVWCGGNEFSPRRNRAVVHTMARAIAENALSVRPFLPASPASDDAHNWLVWHGKAPLSAFKRERAQFLSEFGLQALPHADTLTAALENPRTGWETIHGDTDKLRHYLRGFLPDGHTRTPTLGALIEASQQAQATGLQLAIEHMRRKPRTGGVLIWQFNEPLPAISWAVLDYFRRPKLAVEGLKNWFNPVLVSVDFSAGKLWRAGDVFSGAVWVVNDTAQAVGGRCRVRLDGSDIFSQTVTAPAHSSVRVGTFAHRLAHVPVEMTAIFGDGDRIHSENRYSLHWRDSPPAPWQLIVRRWLADRVMR